MIKCKKCGKKFEGDACPDCGMSATTSLLQTKRKPSVAKRIWNILCTVIVVLVLVVLVLIILDLTEFAHDPANTFIYNVMQTIRDWFPTKTVRNYEALRDEAVYMWNNLWKIIRNGGNVPA